MKASELMIGDLVKTNKGDIIKVESISTKRQHRKAGYHAKDDIAHIKYVRQGQIEPITLTEEILLANGFKNCGSYEWRDEIYVTRYRYRKPDDRDAMFELNFTPCYDGFNIKGIDVNHVHRLQQVLRLYGFNDLADNFKALTADGVPTPPSAPNK